MSRFVTDIPANLVAELAAVKSGYANSQSQCQELRAKYQDALRRLGIARASWDLSGQSVISSSHLATIENERAVSEDEVESLRSELRTVNGEARRIESSYRWALCDLLQGNGITWWAAALLPAALCAAVAAIASVALGSRVAATLMSIFLAFCTAYFATSCYLCFPTDNQLIARMSYFDKRRSALLDILRPALEKLTEITSRANKARELFDVYHDFLQAQSDVSRLEGELTATMNRIAQLGPTLENLERLYGKRSQLLQSNWRELRDIAFENFLCEVFQELGFTVETTRVTGDQGVDVIATRNGKCPDRSADSRD